MLCGLSNTIRMPVLVGSLVLLGTQNVVRPQQHDSHARSCGFAGFARLGIFLNRPKAPMQMLTPVGSLVLVRWFCSAARSG